MILRKTAVEEGKDWDWLLPYVLFAYREVKGREFRECRVTHPDDAGQNGGDEGARDGEHGKGTNNTEKVVRPERLVQRAENWQ